MGIVYYTDCTKINFKTHTQKVNTKRKSKHTHTAHVCTPHTVSEYIVATQTVTMYIQLCSAVLGIFDESSEVFVWDEESVGEWEVGGGAGPTTLTEPVSDG